MRIPAAVLICFAGIIFGYAPLRAQPQSAFRIAPAAEALLDNHCSSCHGEDSQKGDVRFDRLGAMPLAERLALPNRMQEQTFLGQMPPKSRKSQPTEAERKALVEWIAGEQRVHSASTLEDTGLTHQKSWANSVYFVNTVRRWTGCQCSQNQPRPNGKPSLKPSPNCPTRG